MKTVHLPERTEDLPPALQELVRRAIDGTVTPLFVDEENQRILIGSTTASGTAKLQVFGGDVDVNGSGNGIMLYDSNGVKYKLYMDTDGALRADPQ